MKKTLYTMAAAAAIALVAGPVSAADSGKKLKIGVGGYMKQWVGYAKNEKHKDKEYKTFDTKSDAEVYFRGSTKLDNGLTIKVRIDLEGGHGDSGTADDAYLSLVSDKLGTLTVGQTTHFIKKVQQGAPDVGLGLGDAKDWVVNPNGDFKSDRYGAPNRFADDDGNKVIYVTPALYGFSIGGSFQPEKNDENGQIKASNKDDGESWSAGLVYSSTFDNVGVTVSGIYGHKNARNRTFAEEGGDGVDTGDYDVYGGGVKATYAGFTVSGGYLLTDQKGPADDGEYSVDGISYSAGVAYATGPYKVSVGYGYTEEEGKQGIAGKGKNKSTTLMLSGAYDVGQGVTVKASAFKHEVKHENKTAADQDNDGVGVVTGLQVNF